MGRLAGVWIAVFCGLQCAAPRAAPLAASDVADSGSAVASAESPVDVQAWIRYETELTLLTSTAEADRLLLMRQGWQPPSPTWIQGATIVNLGDFPTLDRSAERAARDIETLEWVLAEQRRLAGGERKQSGTDEPEPPPNDGLRSLLPAHWVPYLKAHRDWVAGGGTVLLVIVWGTAAFSRRPTRRDRAAESEPPPRRRRGRRHSHHPPG